MPQFIRDQTAIDAIKRAFHTTRGIPAADIATLETAIHHGNLTHEHFAKLHAQIKEADPASTLLPTLERFATPPPDEEIPVVEAAPVVANRKPSRKTAAKKAAVKKALAKKQAIKVKPRPRKK